MYAFIDAIVTEVKHHKKRLLSEELKTVYFGGGTPSMLSPNHLKKLFSDLQDIIDFDTLTECSFEANPATFTERKITLFRELGINRVSLGIQSFSNSVLKTLGREHNRQQAIDSALLLKKVAMPQVSIDLMFAIPGQTEADWKESLETAISIDPNHISCYNLTYEEDTEFINKLQKGAYKESENTNAHYFQIAQNLLESANYQQYETSNYAKNGMESLHNKSYWAGKDYIGIGPSAVGTLDGERYKNIADTAQYIKQINAVGHAKHDIETIDEHAFRIERIALELRTKNGIALKWLEKSNQSFIKQLINTGHAKTFTSHDPTEKRLQLINEGKLLVDSIVENLI